MIRTYLLDVSREFGDGRGDELLLVFGQLSQRDDLLDTVRLSQRLYR